jgi:GNAT superfamily N-acetyltransferase
VNTISIREALIADIEPIASLVRACIAGMRSQEIDQWDEVYPDQGTIQRDVETGNAVVAIADQMIVGFAVLDEHQEPEYADVPWHFTNRAAVVHRMMVTPLMEGRGIARKLLAILESRAASSGYLSIRLDAFTENPRAVKFYEQRDYRRAGQVKLRKGAFYCFEKELTHAGHLVPHNLNSQAQSG